MLPLCYAAALPTELVPRLTFKFLKQQTFSDLLFINSKNISVAFFRENCFFTSDEDPSHRVIKNYWTCLSEPSAARQAVGCSGRPAATLRSLPDDFLKSFLSPKNYFRQEKTLSAFIRPILGPVLSLPRPLSNFFFFFFFYAARSFSWRQQVLLEIAATCRFIGWWWFKLIAMNWATSACRWPPWSRLKLLGVWF